MADENDGDGHMEGVRDRNLLFSGLSFHLTAFCPTKEHFRQLIEINGGAICKTDKNADLIVSDHLRSKGNVPRAITYKWIEASVEHRALQDTDDFLITKYQSKMKSKLPSKSKMSANSVKARINASGPAPRNAGRNDFTQEDDDILLWWIELAPSKSGNRVYKQLEEAFGRHSFQAWRGRWVKSLSLRDEKYRQISRDFDITQVNGWHEGIRRPNGQDPGEIGSPKSAEPQASKKRRNEEAREDSTAKAAPERSKREKRSVRRETIYSESDEESPQREAIAPAAVNFEMPVYQLSELEQRLLYAKLDELLFADDEHERLTICQDLADEFEGHSAEEFLGFYHQKLKPVVKRFKLKGKLSAEALENAVLQALKADGDEASNAANLSKNGTLSLKHQDVRFERLSGVGVTSSPGKALKKDTASKSSPNRDKTPKSASKRSPGTNPAPSPVHPVMVFSPKYSNSKHRTDAKSLSPSVLRTPPTQKSTRAVVSETTVLRVAQNSPGTPTPAAAVKEIQTINLIDSNEEMIDYNPKTHKLSNAKEKGVEIAQDHIASSPPGSASSATQKAKSPALPRDSPKVALQHSQLRRALQSSPPFATSSSYLDESDPIPFRKPTTLPASAARKQTQQFSSSVYKRRRVGGSERELIVESTPDAKLHPNRFMSSSSPSPSQQLRREGDISDPASSPLANRSRKRKMLDGIRDIAPSPMVKIEEDLEDEESEDDMEMGTDSKTLGNLSHMPEDEEDDCEEGYEDEEDGVISFEDIKKEDYDEEEENDKEDDEEYEEEGLLPAHDTQRNGSVDDNDYAQSAAFRDDIRTDNTSTQFLDDICEEFDLDDAAATMIMDCTCNEYDLVIQICEAIKEHRKTHSNLEDFTWPTGPGIWTEEDDALLTDGAGEEQLHALAAKHGEANVRKRWDWLATIMDDASQHSASE